MNTKAHEQIFFRRIHICMGTSKHTYIHVYKAYTPSAPHESIHADVHVCMYTRACVDVTRRCSCCGLLPARRTELGGPLAAGERVVAHGGGCEDGVHAAAPVQGIGSRSRGRMCRALRAGGREARIAGAARGVGGSDVGRRVALAHSETPGRHSADNAAARFCLRVIKFCMRQSISCAIEAPASSGLWRLREFRSITTCLGVDSSTVNPGRWGEAAPHQVRIIG